VLQTEAEHAPDLNRAVHGGAAARSWYLATPIGDRNLRALGNRLLDLVVQITKMSEKASRRAGGCASPDRFNRGGGVFIDERIAHVAAMASGDPVI